SSIELDVMSSNFPRRIRNTNSGHPLLAADTDTDIRVAVNTVHHSARHPSFLEARVLPNPAGSSPSEDRATSSQMGPRP
ncbi:MAG: CocE/NonD family hydrolase, partial [Pseudonocardiales bacterium]|nr:CocE/NonD family hydrolase [Pseudonocardiales bacterium]